MRCHIPTIQCYGQSHSDIPTLLAVTFQHSNVCCHIPTFQCYLPSHSNVVDCHVPTFQYYWLSHSDVPILWTVTFQRSNIMGCHIPTFQSNLLAPSSGYSNTLMMKAGGGVQTNPRRPSSGFEETPVCLQWRNMPHAVSQRISLFIGAPQ
jgi:hypothetical protein